MRTLKPEDSADVARKLLIYSRALPKGLVGTPKGAQASESAALHYLASKDPSEEVIPSEIASQLGYSRARVTRILDALEARGEIERVPDKQDRRRVLVFATEKGRKTLRETDAKSTAGLMDFIDSLGENDSRELLRILRKGYENTYNSHVPDDLNVQLAADPYGMVTEEVPCGRRSFLVMWTVRWLTTSTMRALKMLPLFLL